MENNFSRFFEDKNYIRAKNSLFNYKNRKKEISGIWKKYFNEEKNKLEEDIRILDIGSGISPVSPIPEKTIFGEISDTAVKIMKKQGYNAKKVSLLNVKEKKESFDWIFCSEVLEHIKDYKKAIKELNRILKKEGKAVITVPVYMEYWDIDDEFVGHYRRFEPTQIRKDFENVGFKILEEKPIGSKIERKLTVLLVKIFKKEGLKKISDIKLGMIRLINYVLYLILIKDSYRRFWA